MVSLLYEFLSAIEVHQRDWRASLYTGTGKALPPYAFSCLWRTSEWLKDLSHKSHGKSLFTGVYSCMLLEISGLTKTSTTVMTSIWFLSCICSVRWPKRAFWATVVLICLFRSLDWLNRFPQWSHFKGLPPVRDSSGTLGDRSNCHDLSSIQSHS